MRSCRLFETGYSVIIAPRQGTFSRYVHCTLVTVLVLLGTLVTVLLGTRYTGNCVARYTGNCVARYTTVVPL